MELLVVIGIIGLLVGVLLSGFGKSTESARMVKCAANMRNLAMAVRSSGAAAQSYQYAKLNSDNIRERGIRYEVRKGWISYLDKGTDYPLKKPQKFSQPSFAGAEEDKLHALTNGAIWKTIGGNHDCYLCPSFVRICNEKGLHKPGWSYQMNAYFGYEPVAGAATASDGGELQTSRADRILLFAEIPVLELEKNGSEKSNVSSLPPVKLEGDAGDPLMDGCLLYKEKGGNESIGFNHRRGKQIVGHVAFADGHVEAIVAPKDGNFVELTDWLCRGCDVVCQGGSYQEVKDSDVE